MVLGCGLGVWVFAVPGVGFGLRFFLGLGCDLVLGVLRFM